jgi:hypothetical protein
VGKQTKAGRKSEYRADYAAMVRALVANPVSIMVRGKVSDAKLAAMIGVDRETIRRWRTLVAGRENCYQADFANACRACQDAIDAGAIKRSMVERAQGFVQVKKVREIDKDTGMMRVIREEKTRMAGDPTAAKLVLHNIQKELPEGEKWDTSDKVQNTHEVGKSLAEFLKDFE